MNRPRARRWARGTAACALTALAAGACAFPTEAPIVEQRWNVPAKSTEISVAELLPASVGIQGNEFTIAVDAPAVVTRTLYQDCADCAAGDGTTIAKPTFTAVASSSTNLPSDVASATLTGGAVTVAIRNDYAFDPLRPATGVTGTITLRVSNGATVLGTATANGVLNSLPTGGTLNLAVPLIGAVQSGLPITVRVEISSPAGDPVHMSSTQRIVVTPTVIGVRTGAAAVRVVNRHVATTSEIDLSDVDDAITQRLDSAAIRLSLTNPFAVAGTLTATLEAPGMAPLTRPVALTANASSSEQVLRYTAEQIRPYFGHKVTLRVQGNVNAGTPVTVTPAQAVAIASRLDLHVAFGR